MNITQITNWLQETDPDCLIQLWQMADQVRRQNVGDAVHLRGLLEISNYCDRRCAYCGISALSQSIPRYRMTETEIMTGVQQAVQFGYGTVVLQAGEDYHLTTDWVSKLIRRIKTSTPLAVTLSLGERSKAELIAWRQASADRYLLRFETSDPKLYQLIHPTNSTRNRLAILTELKQLGYEVGSGVMIGIPGQSYRSLANDLLLFRKLDLDMIGVGPYIPAPHTPLGSGQITPPINPIDQVPNTEAMTYKVIALTRLLCPQANIPSTTALATVNKLTGRELGLMRGANVMMPNLTPPQYRKQYTIYPDKACLSEDAIACHNCIHKRLRLVGRTIGTGPGRRSK